MMGMSTPGLPGSLRRTRQSRHNSASLWSWSSSCSLSQARLHHSQLGQGTHQHQPPPVVDQAASTSRAEASLPHPLWPHSGGSALGAMPGDLQLLLPIPTGQHSALPHSNPLPAVPMTLGSPAGKGATTDALLQQPWPSPVSPNMLTLGPTSSPHQVSSATGLPLAQVPTSLRGKIQWVEYVDLSELLAYDFQYPYSSLDDGQALEIVDGKLSLAPKHRAQGQAPVHFTAMALSLAFI